MAATLDNLLRPLLRSLSHACVAEEVVRMMVAEQLFLVTTSFDTGHGDVTEAVLLTRDFSEVLRTVDRIMRGEGDYASRFAKDDHGVYVDIVNVEEFLPRNRPSRVVCFRYSRETGTLAASWSDRDLTQRFPTALIVGLKPGTALKGHRWIIARKRDGNFIGVRDTCDEPMPQVFGNDLERVNMYMGSRGGLPSKFVPTALVIPEDLDELRWIVEAYYKQP